MQKRIARCRKFSIGLDGKYEYEVVTLKCYRDDIQQVQEIPAALLYFEKGTTSSQNRFAPKFARAFRDWFEITRSFISDNYGNNHFTWDNVISIHLDTTASNSGIDGGFAVELQRLISDSDYFISTVMCSMHSNETRIKHIINQFSAKIFQNFDKK